MAPAPAVGAPQNVYLLQMTNGLDQYIATHLARQGSLRVVTDPALADVILTDRLGKPFEQKMAELYPPPAPETAPEEKEERSGQSGSSVMDIKGDSMTRLSSFGRGRGNIFLVSRKSSAVLWSTFVRLESSRPRDLDRLGREIVNRLGKEFNAASAPSH